MKKYLMIILYVRDQQLSSAFYEKILDKKPVLNVPGMTEFLMNEELKLGLMPEKGIAKIICPLSPDPASGNGIPRCEIYLPVIDPAASLAKAIEAGAKKISPSEKRDWGDTVSYCADPDGHIIAFAK